MTIPDEAIQAARVAVGGSLAGGNTDGILRLALEAAAPLIAAAERDRIRRYDKGALSAVLATALAKASAIPGATAGDAYRDGLRAVVADLLDGAP